MTSPAQLKYLDAIGIPVWVSRDLVINLELEPDVSESAATGDFQAKASQGHVDSLLHDLNAQQGQTTTPAVAKAPDQNPVVAPSSAPNSAPSSVPRTFTSSINKTDKQPTEIARTASQTIYACGDLNADWMIIGESPDISTNGQGQPYANDTGVLLSNMLKAVGIKEPRRNAYLVNILKSSMQDQSDAENTQINNLLIAQIQKVKPKIVLAVGQIAAQNLLKTKEPLVRLRGKAHLLSDLQIPLVVTYYPSYLLSKPKDKRKAWEDLKLAMSVVVNE